MEELTLPCYELGEENYFHGFINNEEFCISDNVDGYSYKLVEYNRTSTLPGETWSSGNYSNLKGIRFKLDDVTLGNNRFDIKLSAPSVPADSFDILDQLDNLENMTDLPIRSQKLNQEGFQFFMTYTCTVKDGSKQSILEPKLFYYPFTHDHYSNPQPDSVYIRITKYKKQDHRDYWKYDIDFEISIKLYYNLDGWQVFGMLENSIFSTSTIVSK